MNFKKTSIIKRNNNILNIIWIVSIWVIFIVALIMVKNINFIKIKIDEQNIIKENTLKHENERSMIEKFLWLNKETSIEIENSNDITILLVWRWWWNHDAPDLTDTIIVTKINTKNKIISMISIPRDLYVKYPWDDNYYGRINWVYSRYMYQKNDTTYWMQMLKNKITEITWEEIDYFVNIDFSWFQKIIDTIWWININIPENFVDYQYPDWNWWYKTLVFKKWIWLFDWENALKYTRSRHSTSDFDRSLRQQQIISAIKDKLTWSYFLTSPLKIKELYQVFIDNVKTDLSLTKMLKIAYSIWTKEEFKISSSNMNDSCFYGSNNCEKWWILYIPDRELFGWMSVLLINWTDIWNLSNYEESIKYSNIILNYSWIEKENSKINIFNSIKIWSLASELWNNIKKYWFIIPEQKSIWNTTDIHEKTVIYYNNISKNSDTIKALKTFFEWDFIEIEAPKYSTENANIEIIIWKDYIWKEKVFNF